MIFVKFTKTTSLTYFQPMFHFYTPLKTSENRRFSVVFRGYRNETLVENGLKKAYMSIIKAAKKNN